MGREMAISRTIRAIKRYIARRIFASPKCLADAIAPLLTLNRIMGLRTFESPRGRPRSILSLIYLLLILGIYCTSLSAQHEYFSHVKLLKLEYVLYELLMYFNTLIVTYEMFLGWCYAKRIRAYYEKLFEIDRTLERLGSTVNYGRTYFVTIGAMITWFAFIFVTSNFNLVVMQTRTSLRNTIFLTVSYAYGLSVSSIVIFEFSSCVKCLQIRFKLVNGLLSGGMEEPLMKRTKASTFAEQENPDDYVRIIEQPQKQIFSVQMLPQLNQIPSNCQIVQLRSGPRISAPKRRSSIKSPIPRKLRKLFQMELQSRQSQTRVIVERRRRKRLLQTLRQVHLELCKVSKALCAVFGIQIALEIGVSIMILTGILYNLYVRWIQQSTFDNLVEQVYMTATLGAIYIARLVLLNRTCKYAANEGNKTSEIIHSIYRYASDTDVRDEVQQFALQISQSPVIFSAFGLTLNYQVLTLCLRTVTTYLVIMVQMSNSLESNYKSIGG